MPTYKTPSEDDKKLLRKQLELLSKESEKANISELVEISNVMAKIEAVIMGFPVKEIFQ